MSSGISKSATSRARVLLAVAAMLAAAALLVLTQAAQAQASPPTVTGVSPNTGPASGGTIVTITGTGFAAGATVAFGSNNSPSVTFVSATQLTATTPPGAQGTATIRVTNPDGQNSALSGAFTYVGPAPVITGIAPNTGPSTGGTTVIITGTGFASGATVRFDSTPGTNVVVTGSTQISVVSPAHSIGDADVRVTNPDNQFDEEPNAFEYTAGLSPEVSSVSPNSGTTGGGTPVTITGTNFVAGASVRFGSNLATSVVVVSGTQITARTPAGTGTVDVRVTNLDGQSGELDSAYVYVSTPTPAVTGVSPNTGSIAGGTTVTVTGTGFLPGATVAFGSNNASSVTVVSSTQITATTPAAASASTVGVKVTNTDGKNHTLANAYRYVGAPTASSISPNAGTTSGGTLVTITGTNFGGTMTVLFDGVPATDVTVVSATSLTARTPAHAAGVVSVVVQSGSAQATLANAFTYRVPATVTGITPASGPTAGGTAVTITGTGFVSPMTVTVGGAAATSVNVVNSTTITAVVPARSAGVSNVEVRSSDQVLASGTLQFIYVAAPAPGRIVSGDIPRSGIGLFVFSGGNNQQLTDLAEDEGCSRTDISFFTTRQGRFIGFLPAAPAFVNEQWNDLFDGVIPANLPLVAVCR